MGKKLLLIGEPMGIFIAKSEGKLESIKDFSFDVAGADYNVAVGMRRLWHDVRYVTKVGDDPFGRRILAGMRINGISTADISVVDNMRTGFMLKGKNRSGDPEIFYARRDSAASTMSTADMESVDLSDISYLHLTGITAALSDSCLDATFKIAERARAAGIFISFDPNLRPALWASRERMIQQTNKLSGMSDLVLPGIAEGEILTGSSEPKKIAEFYHKLGVKTVAIKLGSRGAYVSDGDIEVISDGFPVEEVVDTVGAGDGFAVGVLSALMEGLPITEAIIRGNAIGAMQVTHESDNDGLPNRSELTKFMEKG